MSALDVVGLFENLTDDEALALWLRARDDGFQGVAFDELVTRLMGLVCYLAKKAIAGDPAAAAGVDVEEIEGYALEHLVKYLPRYDPSRGRDGEPLPLKSWLVWVMRRLLIRDVRNEIDSILGPRDEDGRGTRVRLEKKELEAAGAERPEATDVEDVAELRLLLERGSSRQTPRMREVLRLRLLGMELPEIGRKLGVRKQTVAEHERNAAAVLRRYAKV